LTAVAHNGQRLFSYDGASTCVDVPVSRRRFCQRLPSLPIPT